ncbi:MAG TPA: nuclear transport factor 2 family protein [Pyrinomonadaceae bacterium]|nr:nuclear transport factor 2 family protein [Pyrinomonadaceae bacterium]
MKRLSLLLLCLAIMCFPAFAQRKRPNNFNDMIKRCYAAWSTLNPDNPAPFYAKDPDLVFFDMDPLKYTGWQQYHDNFKDKVAPGFIRLTITPNNDVKTTRSGNLAVTSLTFHLAAKTKDGTNIEFEGRHTIVWEWSHGRWVIIHEHVSKPLS